MAKSVALPGIAPWDNIAPASRASGSAAVQHSPDAKAGRFDMQRILPILALSVLAVLASSELSRAEITYPWCAQYGGGRGGGRHCGFWTHQQIMAPPSGKRGRLGGN